jgi:hypothetical protein
MTRHPNICFVCSVCGTKCERYWHPSRKLPSTCSARCRATRSIDRRLWDRACPEPNTGCWLWTGSVIEDGYGRLKGHTRALVLAHRFAWEATFGPIPDGFQVLHECDTPPCINPDHLFLGTHTDNMRDMSAKGRSHELRPKRIAA